MEIACAIFIASLGIGFGLILAAVGYAIYKEIKEDNK